MVEKPPLPPRGRSANAGYNEDLSPVDSHDDSTQYLSPTASTAPSLHQKSGYSPYSGGLHDPRASSTQSLRPIESAGANRRTLLIVYIHGFLGNETSFQGFPAHVHSLLTAALVETHVVHTKIYPRYKSRKNVSFARDDFSNWLAPHESDRTDVILVGHSLGGILAAEVALIPCHRPGSREASQHRLLGLIAYDVPYLGMHPGVVGTGIASLFRAPPDLPESPSTGESPLLQATHSWDPNFNPAFPNDVHLAERHGKLQRAWYFWNKHAGELMHATGRYVSSHVEFGGVLADYPGMRRRYNAIRAMEDIDELRHPRTPDGRRLNRMRFVNYYSASTGRIKERSPSPKGSPSPTRSSGLLEPPDSMTEMQHLPPRPVSDDGTDSGLAPPSASPRLSLEEYRDGEVITKDLAELNIDAEPPTEDMPPTPADTTATSPTTPSSTLLSPTESYSTLAATNPVTTSATSISNTDDLPPLPQLPTPPPAFDGTLYSGEDTVRLARKEHERQVKAYERAIKDHAKSVRDREKLLERRRREAAKRHGKLAKQAKQDELRAQKEQLKRSSTLNPEDYDRQLELQAQQQQLDDPDNPRSGPRKLKDRKFCSLPGKDPQTGARDPTWIRVYMEGMDEVVAHTSMFKMSETYVKMVGDTAERIESWVAEDATRRLLLAEMQDSPGGGPS